MKNKFLLLAALAGLSTAVLTGCVNTVSGNKTAAIPFIPDRVEARYERSLDQVFNAAKDVLVSNGAIGSAGTLFNATNDVRVIEGKIKQDNVWIRVEGIDARLTQLTVQVRTTKGTSDMALAHELDKEVALHLSR
jgi:hypothetical protein